MAASPVRAAAQVAGGALRHAAWWVRYQLHGHTHPTPPEPRKRQSGERRSAE